MFVSGARGFTGIFPSPINPHPSEVRSEHERIMTTDASKPCAFCVGLSFFDMKPMETVYLKPDKTKTFDSP